jgi:hypothetical protein
MSLFIICVSQRPKDGADIAEAEHDRQPFRAVSRHGATMALARLLKAAGVPDGPWQAIGTDGRLRFYGPSLHRLAALTIADSDDGRLRVVPFARPSHWQDNAASAADPPTAPRHAPAAAKALA